MKIKIILFFTIMTALFVYKNLDMFQKKTIDKKTNHAEYSSMVKKLLKTKPMEYKASFFDHIDKINDEKFLKPLMEQYPNDANVSCGDVTLSYFKYNYHKPTTCECYDETLTEQELKICIESCKEDAVSSVRNCLIMNLPENAQKSKKRDYSDLDLDE